MLDCLFISPGSSEKSYQELSEKYSAVETPTWALLLAESCRSVGFNVAILDINAENYSKERDFKLAEITQLIYQSRQV